jgi:hypothetical protein
MDAFKKQLIKFLKGEFVKLALKKILGSVAFGGFKGWLVKFIATELFDQLGEPIIRYAIRKGQLAYDKAAGEITIKKVERAKENNDEDAYSDSISNV